MKVIVVVVDGWWWVAVVGASGNYQDMQLSHEQNQLTETCGMSILSAPCYVAVGVKYLHIFNLPDW